MEFLGITGLGRRAAVAALAASLVLLAPACGSSEGGDRIDPRALERELTGVLGLELAAAHFYERRITVDCVGAGDDGLHFACHVEATNAGAETQSWVLNVSCVPPGDRDEPRCFSDNGDALQ